MLPFHSLCQQQHNNMKLTSPFIISPRLSPALPIADAILSFDKGRFVFDFADGSEHVVTDFNFPQCRISGTTEGRFLQDAFSAILSFLGACAESRNHAERRGKDAMEGEHSSLFPESVGVWAQLHSDEIACLDMEITESFDLISS